MINSLLFKLVVASGSLWVAAQAIRATPPMSGVPGSVAQRHTRLTNLRTKANRLSVSGRGFDVSELADVVLQRYTTYSLKASDKHAGAFLADHDLSNYLIVVPADMLPSYLVVVPAKAGTQ
ncbi:hypothetical protein [Dyella sp. 2HG41-7]|uniref:hypothetical protein n=1 Tax=Dyella sp. 2HG41-7 TaxID=2883239 RepID=UPI001F29BC84|nr:hypothetical protein [Dyella sp. 2HG41-7]